VSAVPFKSVLVANRGEIAVRILRTAKRRGLEGLIVHHAVDRDSPAVRLADRAIEIAKSAESAALKFDPRINNSEREAVRSCCSRRIQPCLMGR